jgi:hypothetical protein
MAQDFTENNIYIIGRGSISKQRLIAANFNLQHTYLTHISIGYVKNNQVKIFEINPGEGDDSKITETTWAKFHSISNNYIGVWYCKSDSININLLETFIQKKIKSNTTYDSNFDLRSENQDYCSEFVANCLNSLNNFKFLPTKKKLNRTHSGILQREELEYFPADFFLTANLFKTLYESKK